MNIIVLVKQVPNTTEIMVDRVTGTLVRDNVESIVNPDDLAGVEAALQLKEKYGATVSVLTMGPPQAKSMLRELLGMGCDHAYLITDRKFAGADTWATSNTLVSALKNIPYDLIIAGRQAIDGDTAQVGPQVAEKLNIPQITYVHDILECTDKTISVRKQMEDSFLELETSFPCLITSLTEMNSPRYMNVENLWDSFEKEITVFTADDLKLDDSLIGLNGSPTKVKKTFAKEVASTSEVHQVTPEEGATIILNLLKEKQVVTH